MSKGTVFDKKGANLPNAVTRGVPYIDMTYR